MIVIDKEKCIGCGKCLKVCYSGALKIEEKKAKCVKEDCLHCGQCVAICPANAVSIPDYDMEEVEEYDEATFSIAPENYLHAVKFRRSIRDFKPEKIEHEKMADILNAGRYSATARNLQACQFILVQDELEEFKKIFWEEIPTIAESLKETLPRYHALFTYFYRRHKKNPEDDALFFNTPSFLVIAAENPWDAGLAAANIENMAVASGAGVLYSGYTMRLINASPVLKEWLGIGDAPVACCLLMGYPTNKYLRTAPRKKGNITYR